VAVCVALALGLVASALLFALQSLAAARSAESHPLGWNGIPGNQVIEVGKAKNLGSIWATYRNEALLRFTEWRTAEALDLEEDGVARMIKPNVNKFGKTDNMLSRDESADDFLAYFDVNTSPDTTGINAAVMQNQIVDDRIGTIGHEFLHAQGGGHPGGSFTQQAPFCGVSLLTSFGACGDFENNTRISSPGSHDTADAQTPDEEGGWSDYSEIGSCHQAGDQPPKAYDERDPNAALGKEVPFDPDQTIVERYGEPGDTKAQALREAEAAGVVFEWLE
jgi:hypothetical protein